MQNNKQGASQAGSTRGVANNKTSQQAVDALAEAMLKAVNTVVGKLEKRLQKIENGKIQNNIAIDSFKLGGKAPEYYLAPVNLLDNSDFTNPINQRGQTSYSGVSQYTIDRWRTWTKEATITIVDGGIRVTNEALFQYHSTSIIKDGKQYTSVIGYADGSVYCAPFVYPEGNGGIYPLFASGYDDGKVFFRIYPSEKTVAYVALYEGSYTAETLPPYVPKGYAAELLECQRYFLPLDKGCICFGSVNKWGSTFYGTIYTPVAMRTKPSINTTSNNYSLTNNGTQVDLTSTLTVQQMTGNNVQIMMDVTDKGMVAAMVTKLWITDTASSACLSADL